MDNTLIKIFEAYNNPTPDSKALSNAYYKLAFDKKADTQAGLQLFEKLIRVITPADAARLLESTGRTWLPGYHIPEDHSVQLLGKVKDLDWEKYIYLFNKNTPKYNEALLKWGVDQIKKNKDWVKLLFKDATVKEKFGGSLDLDNIDTGTLEKLVNADLAARGSHANAVISSGPLD